MEKEKFYGSLGMRSQTASSRRNVQLKVWEKSETNKQSDSIKQSRLNPKVHFGNDVIFLAAAQNGDVEEVERFLKEGTDVNTVNADGLTALHQVRWYERAHTLPRLKLLYTHNHTWSQHKRYEFVSLTNSISISIVDFNNHKGMCSDSVEIL